jgi:hypothetical protein
MKTPFQDLAHNVVRLKCIQEDGSFSIGTGFIYTLRHLVEQVTPILITNKHVVENSNFTEFVLSKKDDSGNSIPDSHEKFRFQSSDWVHHPNPEIDLTAVFFGRIINQHPEVNQLQWARFDDSSLPSNDDLNEMSSIQDVFMVGYPIGLWDSFNNKPIFRKGIVATHPSLEYESRPQYLIDMAVYSGSSGSPIWAHKEGFRINDSAGDLIQEKPNLLQFIGVLFAGYMKDAEGEFHIEQIPSSTGARISGAININLGLVIPARFIQDFTFMLDGVD